MELTFLLCLAFGVAGGMIYNNKNRPFMNGFLWGFLLGLIGLIVTLCKSEKPKVQ